MARLVTMGVDSQTSARALELAEGHLQVYAGAGHHPGSEGEPDWAGLAKIAGHPKVVAVGEVGLDGTCGGWGPGGPQEQILAGMCELAIDQGLPLSVHTRESAERTHAVLAAHPGVQGVMHYFALDWDWARRFLDLGFYLSFSGLVTRPAQQALREVARRCPADRLLLETDSPYGVPHRRRPPNRAAFMLDTASLVADLRGLTLEDLAQLEATNAHSVFTKLG